MWITKKKLRENVNRMNILKMAGYKINLPFGAEGERALLTSPLLYVILLIKAEAYLKACSCYSLTLRSELPILLFNLIEREAVNDLRRI